MIITITGTEGSGKSTIGELLAKKLGYNYYCMGDIRRKMADDMGITLAQLNKLGETDKSTDTKVDDFQTKLGKTEDNFVVVGRTSYHFIPHSFKIFLYVSPEDGAKRIISDKNPTRTTEKYKDMKDAIKQLKERAESDKSRYMKYYGIDMYKKSQYDLYLDTSSMSIDEVLKSLLSGINKKRENLLNNH